MNEILIFLATTLEELIFFPSSRLVLPFSKHMSFANKNNNKQQQTTTTKNLYTKVVTIK